MKVMKYINNVRKTVTQCQFSTGVVIMDFAIDVFSSRKALPTIPSHKNTAARKDRFG